MAQAVSPSGGDRPRSRARSSIGYGFGDDGSDIPPQPELDPKFGDIVLRPYRRDATGRLAQDRKDFEAKLTELQKRAMGGHLSRTEVSHLKLGRTLGEGNFGRVLAVSPSGKPCDIELPDFAALKIQRKSHMAKQEKELQHVRDEKNLAFAFNCPFLVRIIDYFQDVKQIFFLMELCNAGELWSIIQGSRRTRLEPKVAKFWAAQVAMAFEYLHNVDVIFRDLKPENLLVDHKGYLKLTDFGFAKRVSDRAYTMCGTPEYMAPEIIQGRGYGHDVDWWAFGILCYEMNHGLPPFTSESQLEMFKKIQACKVRYQSHMPKDLCEMIGSFVVPDVSARLSCNKHNGMDRIKALPYFKGVNWDGIYAGKVASPYKLKIKGPGDVSGFDRYEEKPVHWHGTGKDGYKDMFLGF
eukprot:m.182509 g.182509  ORF g.182509 m.182509 type:complete len:409 (+) comp15552_c0_seq1:39-1265(+)